MELSNMNKYETQYQMSDELYEEILIYMKFNKLNINQLAKRINIPPYFLFKIMNRKIKMHSYPSLLSKIAKICEASPRIKICQTQPTKTSF